MNALSRPLGKLALGLLAATALGACATPPAETAKNDTMRVNHGNLPQVLEAMEEQVKPGMKVNDYVVVKEARASGSNFTTSYVVDIPDDQVNPADFRKEEILKEARAMCASKDLQTLMTYGATFDRVYRAPGGTLLYKLRVNEKRCQKLTATR